MKSEAEICRPGGSPLLAGNFHSEMTPWRVTARAGTRSLELRAGETPSAPLNTVYAQHDVMALFLPTISDNKSRQFLVNTIAQCTELY